MVQKKKHIVLDNSGQLIIEYIMLLAISVGLLTFAFTEIRNKDLVGKIFVSQFELIQGVLETGEWQTPEEARGSQAHPHEKISSRVGDNSN